MALNLVPTSANTIDYDVNPRLFFDEYVIMEAEAYAHDLEGELALGTFVLDNVIEFPGPYFAEELAKPGDVINYTVVLMINHPVNDQVFYIHCFQNICVWRTIEMLDYPPGDSRSGITLWIKENWRDDTYLALPATVPLRMVGDNRKVFVYGRCGVPTYNGPVLK